jgi:tetratricopeptide (TPR) repeat protein
MLSHLLVALTLLGQTSAPAPQAPPADATDALGRAYFLFLQGHQLEAQNDMDGAIAAYRRAAELFPRAADVHAELALIFARQGNAADSLKAADTAIAIEPDNRNARRLRGLIKADLADAADQARAAVLMNDAIEDLEVVAADRLTDPTVTFALGRLYVRTSRYDQGIERLRVYLLERPTHPEARQLLVDAYEQSGRLADAIEVQQGLAAALPDQARVWTRLGDLQERAGGWQAAAATWAALAERNPRSLPYRLRQATALANSGDVAASREVLGAVTALAPRDISAWFLLSQVERRAGEPARAEDAARRIIEIDPDDVRGPMALAGARAARGDYRGVIEVLDPLVRTPRPQDVAAGSFARMASELAVALDEVGDERRAVSVLEQARLRDTGSVDLLFSLGAAYERAERFDQAERTFRQVIAREPGHANALNYLGYMLADRGTKLDEAVGLITRALAIEPGNPSFLDSLGWAYVKQEKLTEARDPLTRAAAALPDTSVIHDHLAELYFQLELYREAAAAWDRALAGDRSGVDVGAITRKRDRARTLAGSQ